LNRYKNNLNVILHLLGADQWRQVYRFGAIVSAGSGGGAAVPVHRTSAPPQANFVFQILVTFVIDR
jgi:hypothetical protein